MDTMPFGRTGHQSTRVIFGAAALGAMRQEKADQILELLLEYGINHIDTAASYGDAELRIGPWMARYRERVLPRHQDRATAPAAAARDSVQRSLERLRVDQIDLIQLHNLVDEDEWKTALGSGGALEALVEARDQRAGALHRRHRSRHAGGGDAPAQPGALSVRQRAAAVQLHDDAGRSSTPRTSRTWCGSAQTRGVAVQTIKSVARRRWQEEPARRFSWYEPLRDRDAIRRAVHFVLSRPGLFLNSSSDATILRAILDAASEVARSCPRTPRMQADVARYAIEPLFVRGVSDAIWS